MGRKHPEIQRGDIKYRWECVHSSSLCGLLRGLHSPVQAIGEQTYFLWGLRSSWYWGRQDVCVIFLDLDGGSLWWKLRSTFHYPPPPYCSSVTKSCLTLCYPVNCSTPGFLVPHHLPCPLGCWCHPTISSSVTPFSSCLQSFPAIFLSFSFSISPFIEYSELISFRID